MGAETITEAVRRQPEDDPRGRCSLDWKKESMTIQKYGTDPNFKREIVWTNAIGIAGLHVAALYGVWLAITEAKWQTIVLTLTMIFLFGEGILMGAHRLWTHRAFKATFPVRLLLLVFFTAAGENCLWVWVRDHRQHHKYADTDADPHNATRGLFFSHMGWLMSRKHPLVFKTGKDIRMDDIEAEKMVMFQKRYYKTLFATFGVLIPMLIPMRFWGETATIAFFACVAARYVILLHLTWSVNSLAHAYGTKPYNKNILATDSVSVSVATLGEGWHNYHHVYPSDYRAAELGTPFQGTTRLIDALARLGLVYDTRVADVEAVRRKRESS